MENWKAPRPNNYAKKEPKAAPIPREAPQSNWHIVNRGETMQSIAALHGQTKDELVAKNSKAGHPAGNFDNLFIGDRIVL